jgi:hypothetical protein
MVALISGYHGLPRESAKKINRAQESTPTICGSSSLLTAISLKITVESVPIQDIEVLKH